MIRRVYWVVWHCAQTAGSCTGWNRLCHTLYPVMPCSFYFQCYPTVQFLKPGELLCLWNKDEGENLSLLFEWWSCSLSYVVSCDEASLWQQMLAEPCMWGRGGGLIIPKRWRLQELWAPFVLHPADLLWQGLLKAHHLYHRSMKHQGKKDTTRITDGVEL